MQTLTRVEPCGCAYGRDCTRTTYCKAGAAVEAEAEEWRREVDALRAERDEAMALLDCVAAGAAQPVDWAAWSARYAALRAKIEGRAEK